MKRTSEFELDEFGAVQGIPLSLVIAMVLLLLVTPIAFEALQNFSESSSRTELEIRLEKLYEVALVVYSSQSGGYTSTLQHELEISVNDGVRVNHLRIGADLRGPDDFKAYYMEYAINDDTFVVINRGQNFPIMVDGSGSLIVNDITTVEKLTLRLSLVGPEMSDPLSPCGGSSGIDIRFVCIEVIDNA